MPLSILVFLFQYQIIKVESASMERTLKNGDVILVKKIRQKKDKNQNDINKQLRDRIVVFNNPSREGMLFVKRCIAISGDTLTLNNHEFYRNGKKLVNCDKILNRYYVKTHDFDLFNQHVDGSRLSIIKTSSEYFIVDTNLEILRSLVSDSIISIFSDPLLKGKLFNNVENTLIIPQKNDKLTELCKNTFGELFFQLEISNKLIRH